ncbi:2-hydroxyacid dehydrogenase [Waterburya agarophytonicola K14]|uniref:2-hydroxyacid dehydrogenase n=1 Tax=Waterburya agarophytonicola KI4 TaxID=2874699 RepID=A0A964FFZ0_9CYAN|nr:2-hydroxyacid dehydrogenase [Waterburya agarophytonicola]MCC0178390.1 2-hydroxyacid dehydrogenase [Waterburya agarophytonicola KI4]
MKVAVFGSKSYDRLFLEKVNQKYDHDLYFITPNLDLVTAALAKEFPAICVFVNDILDRPVLEILADQGVKLIALRCAGYDNVDLKVAQELGLSVVRVPAYSPYAVAEHAIALILTLNRKTHKAYNRVREGNFALEGLLGFDLHNRVVGIIGTGKIGRITGQILHGFGCQVLAYDPYPDREFGDRYGNYVDLKDLLTVSDIISLHCPLTAENHHLIDDKAIALMKPGVMLINTSRGALIDTQAVIKGLKSSQIGHLALDVYERESNMFFEDLSAEIIQDDIFQRLLTFPNVIITGHQAFFTTDALENIAETTLSNIAQIEQGKVCPNQISI